MSKIIMMCRCPGSGKSTWAHKYVTDYFDECIVVSRDAIRFDMVKEDEEYFSKEKAVFREFVDQIKEGIDRGYDVIADATHLNPASRRKLFSALVDRGITINDTFEAVIIDRPLSVCLAQNELRKGTRAYVPEDVLVSMWHNFKEPEYDDIPMYFDKIWRIENDIMVLKNKKEEE